MASSDASRICVSSNDNYGGDMKYEYKAINIYAIKEQSRRIGTPEVQTQFDVINEEGQAGWKCLNPWDGQTLYFEKELKS